MRHGLWETYGPRGVTFFSGKFIEDEPDGLHVWRFVNDKPESEKHYDRGVRSGEWRDFYNTGSVKRRRTYSDGLIDGEDRCYFENGFLATLATYRRGQLDGPSLEFHSNGKLNDRSRRREAVLRELSGTWMSRLECEGDPMAAREVARLELLFSAVDSEFFAQ